MPDSKPPTWTFAIRQGREAVGVRNIPPVCKWPCMAPFFPALYVSIPAALFAPEATTGPVPEHVWGTLGVGVTFSDPSAPCQQLLATSRRLLVLTTEVAGGPDAGEP